MADSGKRRNKTPASSSARTNKKKSVKQGNGNKIAPSVKFLRLPIERHISADLRTVFANHVVIQHDPSVFHILFFEVQKPLIVDDDPKERQRKFQELQKADAHCVARITMPAEQFAAMVRAMQTNLEGYQETIAIQKAIDVNQKGDTE
jgi:hypothetical protein